MTHYLAFDLGASSGRAMLGTLSGEHLKLEEVHRFPTPLKDVGGHLYWDIDSLENELRLGLELALSRAPALRSLSVDSWGVDYVRLDERGKPVSNPFSYRDTRVEGVMQSVADQLGKPYLYQQTGTQFLTFNTLYQVLADTEDGRVVQQLTIADYLNYVFCGVAVIDASLASTTQMMDIRTLDWSTDLMGRLGIDSSTWPAIVPCGTRLGSAASHPNVSVIASCSHDTGAAVAGVPATGDTPEWAYISCGTWSLMGVERSVPLLSNAAMESGFTNEIGLDNSIRFLKNLAGLWILQECVREWQVEVDWSELIDAAAQENPPETLIDPEDLLFLSRGGMEERIATYLAERNAEMPAQRSRLVRLILESIAASFSRCYDDLCRVTGSTPQRIHLVGGGSQNLLLCQLTANRTGVPVVAGPVEATAMGNVLIQARTLGDIPRSTSIRKIAENSSTLITFEPDL